MSNLPRIKTVYCLSVKLELLFKDRLSKYFQDLRPACQLGVRLSGYLSKLLALGNDARKQHWHAVDVFAAPLITLACENEAR